MRVISQDGNFECEYEDLAFCITLDGRISGILSKVHKETNTPDFIFAEYDYTRDCQIELSMLHKRYVALNGNAGTYQFSANETYRKLREQGEYEV